MGTAFVDLFPMDTKSSSEEYIPKKFQVALGEETAWVEVISAKNHIYAVEIKGREPLFITQIRDHENKPCWISIPQGDDELAAAIGNYIEEYKSKI